MNIINILRHRDDIWILAKIQGDYLKVNLFFRKKNITLHKLKSFYSYSLMLLKETTLCKKLKLVKSGLKLWHSIIEPLNTKKVSENEWSATNYTIYATTKGEDIGWYAVAVDVEGNVNVQCRKINKPNCKFSGKTFDGGGYRCGIIVFVTMKQLECQGLKSFIFLKEVLILVHP